MPSHADTNRLSLRGDPISSCWRNKPRARLTRLNYRPSVSGGVSMRSGGKLSLVNGFDLTLDGARIALSAGHQRLVAYLGLQSGAVLRGRVAAEIWPDRTDNRAVANLRSLLFRLPLACRRVVDVQTAALGLVGDVSCDVHDFVSYARRL